MTPCPLRCSRRHSPLKKSRNMNAYYRHRVQLRPRAVFSQFESGEWCEHGLPLGLLASSCVGSCRKDDRRFFFLFILTFGHDWLDCKISDVWLCCYILLIILERKPRVWSGLILHTNFSRLVRLWFLFFFSAQSVRVRPWEEPRAWIERWSSAGRFWSNLTRYRLTKLNTHLINVKKMVKWWLVK